MTTDILDEHIELNICNYDHDDVARLNSWAIQACEEIERLREAKRSLEQKYRHDIDAIRAAMELAIREFDAHSEIDDPIDEARLEGMRAMLSCFNAEAASCRHLGVAHSSRKDDIERLRDAMNDLLEAARKAAAVIPKVANPSIAEAQEAFLALVTAIHKAEGA